MTASPRAIRRLCLVVDVESYSRHDNLVQARMMQRLAGMLRGALAAAGIARRRTDDQDRGDGRLVVLPPGVDEGVVLPGLVRGLLSGLDADRTALAPGEPRVRLRVALSQGVVQIGPTGFVGRAVVTACRLVDADVVRSELRRVTTADLCLAVTDDLFHDVLAHGYGGLPAAGFRPIRVQELQKGFDTLAWLQPLGPGSLPPDDTAVVLALSLSAMPLAAAAGFGTDRAWEAVESDGAAETDHEAADTDEDEEAPFEEDGDADDIAWEEADGPWTTGSSS